MIPGSSRPGRPRVGWWQVSPPPTAEEEAVLLAALELALATEAKEIPASGWSAPQYRDGSSIRPGMRIWTAGQASEAPSQPAFPRPPRRP